MIQITPQMRVLVGVEPADFRCGIDALAERCRKVLEVDPFSGAAFVFRNRRRTAIKILIYDGQGFWLCHKRFSSGRFAYWPTKRELEVHELAVLVRGGDPRGTRAAEVWRRVDGRP
jgi:transposase